MVSDLAIPDGWKPNLVDDVMKCSDDEDSVPVRHTQDSQLLGLDVEVVVRYHKPRVDYRWNVGLVPEI